MPKNVIEDDDFDLDDIEGEEEHVGGHEAESDEVELSEDKPEPKSDELGVEIEPDPIYEKPKWKADPIELNEDELDKELKGKRVAKRIGGLKAANTEINRQLQQTKKEREDAIRLLRQMEARMRELEQRATQGDLTALERAAEKHDADVSVAFKEMQSHLTAGELDKYAEANRRLSEAQANAIAVRNEINKRKSQPVQQSQPQQQVQQPSQPQVDPAIEGRVADWMANNKWFRQDGGNEMSNYAIAVHNKVLAEAPDAVGSDEYFATIDRAMKKRFPDYFGVKKPVSPVTPSTRGAVQTKRVSGTTITLPQSAYNIACELYGIEKGDTSPAAMKKLRAYAIEYQKQNEEK